MRERWCFVDRYCFQTYTCDKIRYWEEGVEVCEIESMFDRKLGKKKEWLYVLGGRARCGLDALILL